MRFAWDQWDCICFAPIGSINPVAFEGQLVVRCFGERTRLTGAPGAPLREWCPVCQVRPVARLTLRPVWDVFIQSVSHGCWYRSPKQPRRAPRQCFSVGGFGTSQRVSGRSCLKRPTVSDTSAIGAPEAWGTKLRTCV